MDPIILVNVIILLKKPNDNEKTNKKKGQWQIKKSWMLADIIKIYHLNIIKIYQQSYLIKKKKLNENKITL
jgi:hypothetical protein